MNTLQKNWDIMVQIGFEVRSNNKNGFDEWQPYKLKYNYKIDFSLLPSFQELVNSLNYQSFDAEHEKVLILINDQLLNNKIETEHFFVQHFRIPKMVGKIISITKLMQIAYNVGQLKAVFQNENVFDENIKKYYVMHRLNKLDTYVDNKFYEFQLPN